MPRDEVTLTRETIQRAMDDIMAASAQPNYIIVHPKTAWRLNLWMRWWRSAERLVKWPSTRLPRWIRRRVYAHRKRLADQHFDRWMKRQTYRPPTPIPGARITTMAPEDVAYVANTEPLFKPPTLFEP